MKKKTIIKSGNYKSKNKKNNAVKIIFALFILIFLLISVRVLYIQVTKNFKGYDLVEYSSQIYSDLEVIQGKRGTIYDKTGTPLAINVETYDVVAILDEEYKDQYGNYDYVVNVEETAKNLSNTLADGENYQYFLNQLSKDNFQVEFGKYGTNITYGQKEAIEEMNMPGIHFTTSDARYYPYGDFASYIIGYAKLNEEENELVGEMGIEAYTDNYLKGQDGTYTFESDLYGQALTDINTLVPVKEGVNVYLTIDKTIQSFVEQQSKIVDEKYNADEMFIVVADAKTGAILAATSKPSFNPNDLSTIESYSNALVSSCYEPGSTFKTFLMAAAIESGIYSQDETFYSGTRTFTFGDEEIIIGDWNEKQGWGSMTMAQGYYLSSNIVMTQILDKLTFKVWENYITEFGFGEKTNIELYGESSCDVDLDYDIEYYNSSFGQGITVNAMQMIQAYTAITNGGEMVQPHIIDKAQDSETGEIIYEAKPKVVGTPISSETANEVLQLMKGVTHYDNGSYRGTGVTFQEELTVDIGGKTGTAQFAEGGSYISQGNNYIHSFMAVAPIDNPEIIVYTTLKNPKGEPIEANKTLQVPIINNTLNYLAIEEATTNLNFQKALGMIGQDINIAEEYYRKRNYEVITLGNKTVEDQYPTMPTSSTDIVILKGSGPYELVNLDNWSYNDVYNLCKMFNIELQSSGAGQVQSYKYSTDMIIPGETNLEVTFQTNNKYTSKSKVKAENNE